MEKIEIYRSLAVFLMTGRGREVKSTGSEARLLPFPQWGEFEEVGASLVAQRLRIRLPMQGTRVRALAREDTTCRWSN